MADRMFFQAPGGFFIAETTSFVDLEITKEEKEHKKTAALGRCFLLYLRDSCRILSASPDASHTADGAIPTHSTNGIAIHNLGLEIHR